MSQISVVKYSEVTKTHRFDAEYYKPEYLLLLNLIEKSSKFTSFKKLGLKVDASAFYPSIEPHYGLGKLPFLRVVNVDKRIFYEEAITIPETLLEQFKTIKLAKKGDIVITKGGSVARVGYISRDSALSRDLIYINSSKLDTNFSKYLFFYFISDFTHSLIIRSASLTAQPHLTIMLIRDLPIYTPEKSFTDKIAKLFDQSFNYEDQSKITYIEAEETLLKELNLRDYRPEHKLSYNAKLSEVLNSKRIDADYYQPKYKEIEQIIKKYSLGSKPLNEVIKIKNKNFFPEDDKEYNYIELSNISSNGNITGCTKDFGKNLPSRARRKVSKGDVIISTIEGSLESCAVIRDEYDGALCSTGFFVINSKTINSETLLVLVKSIIMQNLLKRGCKGTILTAISKDELDKIEIPLIKDYIQKDISQKINESYKLRKESKELLEKAKKMVEDEIEKEAGQN